VLQYEDDTLLILHGSIQQATYAKAILDAFTIFSGLKINYQKITIVPLHMPQQGSENVAQILGCPILSMPCTYLGLPMSMNKISRAHLQTVIQRVDRRLPG
jgi:hypothetical protein